ncbi:MAG: 2-amino-4-hydroxy-6-hydroxymethyldihydropteridine diphosphokinase [Crocinitomicaceae bacterium]|jgi:2-amino-4-hydroxy-6-hydroxymethyldihydropteridine diphosphokinase|nr:2-amino-4-hydroxy-6-hydroxymethyldihydropteridine diphosphokinase [Crocinitomicaceae bacterium]MDP4723942.1 2-amino-4-hydroxy-6-hydroxymethyldihydropteridine diphosphokinase [Crocinitomicaceae bacterium]MDP4740164.1 2-amino-4-hydroxy-6-hydroxymethyldihydropteridine diphosphokinase [Crocinitomicaceae bacterium]MDP4800008.1 2-amino-4-hydroxy-6-hydroxymethyldihydropteridine diphosphokinase [Crocinitomicaceae bacterium]MDP4806942.1 2-amino-4-hydroxy-6-hydroxymethyldihydropteridine diphosphokinas
MEISGNNRVVIAFGSNLGDREANIQKAIDALSKSCGKVVQVSPYYRSAPEGFVSDNEFVNGCLLLLTDLNPYALLKEIKAIETALGRVKQGTHYEDRCIDLDIIFYESLCIQTPDLQIPHPHYQDRDFVLIPLQALNLDFHPL